MREELLRRDMFAGAKSSTFSMNGSGVIEVFVRPDGFLVSSEEEVVIFQNSYPDRLQSSMGNSELSKYGQLIASGSNAYIAKSEGKTIQTLKNELTGVFQEAQVKNRLELVKLAVAENQIDIPSAAANYSFSPAVLSNLEITLLDVLTDDPNVNTLGELALALGLANSSVKNRLHSIYKKIGVRGKVGAVMYNLNQREAASLQ